MSYFGDMAADLTRRQPYAPPAHAPAAAPPRDPALGPGAELPRVKLRWGQLVYAFKDSSGTVYLYDGRKWRVPDNDTADVIGIPHQGSPDGPYAIPVVNAAALAAIPDGGDLPHADNSFWAGAGLVFLRFARDAVAKLTGANIPKVGPLADPPLGPERTPDAPAGARLPSTPQTSGAAPSSSSPSGAAAAAGARSGRGVALGSALVFLPLLLR